MSEKKSLQHRLATLAIIITFCQLSSGTILIVQPPKTEFPDNKVPY